MRMYKLDATYVGLVAFHGIFKFVYLSITYNIAGYGVAVLYRMRILYHTRMVYTICVYGYGITVRVWYNNYTRMVSYFIPYAL